MGPHGARQTTGNVEDWRYGQMAFPFFPVPPMLRYSLVAELSPVVSWGLGPFVGSGCRPVPSPESAVMEAAGEAQAESGGL